MWKPYQERNGRLPDFLVEYRYLTPEEGGRKNTPFQGYRSDLHYDGEDIHKNGIHCVWPEFLNGDGSIKSETSDHVSVSGMAYMWILCFDDMWEFHARNALPGRRCWFMEGSRKVAEAKIIEQIALVHKIECSKS